MTHWSDLPPDIGMSHALRICEPRPEYGASQNDKKNWSARFADACAIMLANGLRNHSTFKAMEVRPNEDGSGREAAFALGEGGRNKKRLDVSAATMTAGLQLAMTLKGGDFPDPKQGHYGKNLTGRFYEMGDEVRKIHEYHPHALAVAIYFLPLAACSDSQQGPSTFARLVAALRRSSGRDDPLLPTQFRRLDHAFVGLYVPDKSDLRFSAGSCRFFDVFDAPPRQGRPRVETTLDAKDVIEHLSEMFRNEEEIEYADPEPEAPRSP